MRKATAFFLAILMIALTACTGNTKMPVESGVSDSMTIGSTDDMLGTTPPSEETETTYPTPSMNPVELVFTYEDLDDNNSYTFILEEEPTSNSSFAMRVTTRREMRILLNGTEIVLCDAGISDRFEDLSAHVFLLKKGENTITIPESRGSNMSITMIITPATYFDDATMIVNTDGGYIMEDGLFGINAEITRKGYFGGLSAEMLNNRKFLMGERGVDGWTCTKAERITDRPQESLCNSNFVVLKDGGSMKQCSDVIALQAGREYEAKVWVKAYSTTAEITFGVSGMEQSFTVTSDEYPYKVLTFTFTGKDVENGTFLVTVNGEAAVYEVSLMPTENFYGMRIDVIESLRALAPTSIRYPGGCFADHYEWRECLKAPEFRTPVDGTIKNFMLRDTYGQDPLDIGINEFMMLCREIGAEPEFTVSILQSDGADARDLIEYCNGSADTEFGSIRQSLGYNAFNIKTWYVGNEVYYFGAQYQNNGVAAAMRTSEIVNAMRTVDPDIAVILGVVADNNLQKWSFDYIANLTCDYELVSYHRYNGSAPNAEPDGKTACDNLESSFRNDSDAGLEFFKNQLFKGAFDTTCICVDEWNFCWGSGSNNALLFSNALEFHFFARTSEKYHIREACFFMPINEGMITVTGTESKVESSGELFRLMANHRGGKVIECTSEEEDLDILCTQHDGYLFVSIVNRGATPYRLNVAGYTASDCTEIRVNEFSFFSNDYDILTGDDATVGGHSVLFVRLTPMA